MTGLFEQFSKEFKRLIHEFELPFENPILTFSILLFIILLSPILLRRIKIPSLIGLIISGVIIGPNGLQLISEANMKTGFVNMFSKIGLLYIMFMAGLELDMQEFRRYRNKSITFGLLTFLVPLLLGYPTCRYALGLSELASLLTASMFATHTLVAYPIVSKFGLSKLEAVAIAVGGTILTDTAVLIILAVISGSNNGEINTSVLAHLAITLSIFSLIMFWGIPKISRWFFKKLEAEKSSQFIYVLSVLFFAAFLAEVAGIEAIIGAFVAGLVMNRLIPHSSILMNRVEFIGNALFIPFFLISIGMVVNVSVLANNPWAWVVAGVLTSFAIFSKFLAAWFTQMFFKLKRSDRQIIFGLSTAHAAATLAVINVGYTMGILDISIVNGTVILILITSMVASFVTENVGKKLLIEKEKNNSFENLSINNHHLLVAANELEGNEKLCDFSILISDKSEKYPISVVNVIENNEHAEELIFKSRRHIDDFIAHYNEGAIKIDARATIDHSFSSGIGRVSKEIAADVVLLNDNSKSNLLNRLIGDEREHLLDMCDKTVFFCHFNHVFTSYRKIILVCPAYAELEQNSKQWVDRILRLSKELNLDMDVYSTRQTFEKLKTYRTAQKYSTDLTFFKIETPEDVLPKLAKFENENLFISVFARTGSVSAFTGLESLPQRMEKENPHIDRVFVYPSQSTAEAFVAYEDMSGSPLAAGVETIQRLSKEVGGLFKKGEE